MRKTKMITRTIKVTKFDITYFDLEINEVRWDALELVGTPTDKEIEKQFNTENPTCKFIKLDNVEVTEKLYGLSEEMFLQYAVELDENRKEVK
jgi:hypothetical protein|nr:MAG TPA: hypothetical protein [Caudoviricetes sp.]